MSTDIRDAVAAAYALLPDSQASEITYDAWKASVLSADPSLGKPAIEQLLRARRVNKRLTLEHGDAKHTLYVSKLS